jgi:hypothetical protein
MVAFVDPRHSKIDIAQAVGRAMRKPRGGDKKVGYIVVPIFAEGTSEQSLEKAIRSEDFDDVALILNSLLEQDEELVDIVRELKEANGRGEVFNPKRFKDKVEVIGPLIGLDELTNSIYVEAVDRLGESWDEWYGQLVKFKEREGHCRVPKRHTEGGTNLGQWVGKQRKYPETLAEDRVLRLNELGFIWDPLEEQWEESFLSLKKFREREGHCRVPMLHTEGGYRLGRWVLRQRATKDELTEGRVLRLNELGFIWDPLEDKWEEGFLSLKKFKEREGHCRVPQLHTEGGTNLGSWVGTQRKYPERLAEDRRRRLDELGFIWDPLEDKWEEGFLSLKKFKEREGHCRVPVRHTEGGTNLGRWVGTQRKYPERLAEDRRRRLDELGFIWDVLEDQWEEGFLSLKKFKEREGHCSVPKRHTEGGTNLGFWVSHQRAGAETLAEDRVLRLNELGFIWDTFEDQWEEGFLSLKKFKEREGHCSVPNRHTEGGTNLGQWISTQRGTKDELTEDRILRLNELGFIWDPLEDKWEEGFLSLMKFKEREGHCRVPSLHSEGRTNLGSWVGAQRVRAEKLTEGRRIRLEELGFIWNVLEDKWEEGFLSLKKFREREGHCRVPMLHTEGGYRLGRWVGHQRAGAENLAEDRRIRLEELGFIWDPLEDQWEEGFLSLKKFREREGHCSVAPRHTEGGTNLGTWVLRQRATKDELADDRVLRLNELGFVWDARNS